MYIYTHTYIFVALKLRLILGHTSNAIKRKMSRRRGMKLGVFWFQLLEHTREL